jgi:hypothetical protein
LGARAKHVQEAAGYEEGLKLDKTNGVFIPRFVSDGGSHPVPGVCIPFVVIKTGRGRSVPLSERTALVLVPKGSASLHPGLQSFYAFGVFRDNLVLPAITLNRCCLFSDSTAPKVEGQRNSTSGALTILTCAVRSGGLSRRDSRTQSFNLVSTPDLCTQADISSEAALPRSG